MSLPHAIVHATVSWLAIWLLLLSLGTPRMRRGPSPYRATLVTAAAAAGLLFTPVGSFSVHQWLLSVHASPSVLLAGLLVSGITRHLTGRSWLDARDRASVQWCALVMGLVLYASTLGLPGPDLYALAWDGGVVVSLVALAAAALLLAGNRLGILLTVALGARMLGLTESNNLWDYLVDPVGWLVAAAGLLAPALRGRGALEEAVRT